MLGYDAAPPPPPAAPGKRTYVIVWALLLRHGPQGRRLRHPTEPRPPAPRSRARPPARRAGERARRRDLRTHYYRSEMCKSMRRTGECVLGEQCPQSHNVFEYWLHPDRFRTQHCKVGSWARARSGGGGWRGQYFGAL